jgi:hypothetical protein
MTDNLTLYVDLRNQEMGHSTKRKVNNTNEWVAWGWVNEKMKKKSSFIAKKRPNPKSIEQDIKYYHCANGEP